MAKNKFIRGFFFLLCGAGFIVIVGVVVMFLWNWLVPEVFKGPPITFIQALGLFILCKILFGGFRRWGGKHCCGGGHGGRHGFWRKKFEEKYSNLSEEEKVKLKESYKKCCGFEGTEKPD